MKKIMTIAHEIKRAAATKWDCAEKEIVFGICLQMAHKGEEIKAAIVNGNAAERMANLIKGMVSEKESGFKFASGKQEKYYTDLKARLFEHIDEEDKDNDVEAWEISFYIDMVCDEDLDEAAVKSRINDNFNTASDAIAYLKAHC